jgi:hypothetical protein
MGLPLVGESVAEMKKGSPLRVPFFVGAGYFPRWRVYRLEFSRVFP